MSPESAIWILSSLAALAVLTVDAAKHADVAISLPCLLLLACVTRMWLAARHVENQRLLRVFSLYADREAARERADSRTAAERPA